MRAPPLFLKYDMELFASRLGLGLLARECIARWLRSGAEHLPAEVVSAYEVLAVQGAAS